MSGPNALTTAVAGATPGEQEELTRLDAFGLEIARLRKDAIDGRRELGIENEWLEDEEAYVGIDDANRAEFHATWRTIKPAGTGEPFTTQQKEKGVGGSTKSTALVNITRPYCDAAGARIGDMLLPNDDKCWGIEATPLPDLIETARDEVTVQVADGLIVSEKDFAKAIVEVATERAERAQTRIHDWFSEGNWRAEARTVIDDAARIGTGVLKGPTPERRRVVSWTIDPNGGARREVKYKHVPVSRRVDPWDFFPDPACGEDIQDGNFAFERDRITVRRLLKLKGTEGYIDAQIDACIAEGPIEETEDWTPSMQQERTRITRGRVYNIWYYYGLVEREDLEAAGFNVGLLPSGERFFHAIVTMVNHRVIRASLQVLDDGTLPFDVIVWQKRPGMWCGIGVGRQMRVPQRMLTAGIRNMMDNAALSAGPQVIIDSTKIEPVNGVWELVPRKLWKAARDALNGADIDVREAFAIVSIETRQAELMNIIQFALRMAEEATGLPMILQGQLGEKKVETLGQQQMLQNNASSVLRRLAKLFDDCVTVPHVTRYYEWLLEYGPDPREKGDFNIVARGSSTLVERDIQNQGIALILDFAVKAPATEIDPNKASDEYIRSQHLDPKRFKLTDEEKAQKAAEAANAPPDPRVQAAEIKAAADREKLAVQQAEGQAERDARGTEKLLELNHETEIFNAERELAEETGSGI